MDYQAKKKVLSVVFADVCLLDCEQDNSKSAAQIWMKWFLDNEQTI